MRKWWIVWPLYAGLVGFTLGASFFFALYGRNVTESSVTSHKEQQTSDETTKSKKEGSDEALAFYTLWLMAFTGVLAIATVGLGIATVLLYATGEKQFRFAIRSGVRQARDMHASIAAAENAAVAAHKSADTLVSAERPWIFISKITPNAVRDIHGQRHDGTGVPSEIRLQATIQNYGKTPALMRQIAAHLRFSSEPPPMTLSVVPSQFLVLESGGDHTFHIAVGEMLDPRIATQLENGERSVWLHFAFIYRDVSGVDHETAGRWKHHLSLGHWDGEYDKTT